MFTRIVNIKCRKNLFGPHYKFETNLCGEMFFAKDLVMSIAYIVPGFSLPQNGAQEMKCSV